MLIVRAIMTAASVMAGGKADDKLQAIANDYTELIYPETAANKEDKAAITAAILKAEFERGPIKVQAQEYDRKRKRKPR